MSKVLVGNLGCHVTREVLGWNTDKKISTKVNTGSGPHRSKPYTLTSILFTREGGVICVTLIDPKQINKNNPLSNIWYCKWEIFIY